MHIAYKVCRTRHELSICRYARPGRERVFALDFKRLEERVNEITPTGGRSGTTRREHLVMVGDPAAGENVQWT